MKIDVHNHIGYDSANDETRSYEELLEEMKSSGVDKCLIFPFTSNPDVIEQNEVIKEAFNERPKQLIPFALINPKLPNTSDLIYEYHRQGFKGIVTDPRSGVDHGEKLFHETMECAYMLDMPVWLHSDDKETIMVPISPMESMLNKYPQIKFILSSVYYDSMGIASRHRNVYIDTAVFELGQDLVKMLQPIGAHRILMGSHTPYGMLKREIDKINISLEFSDYQKSLIFWRNTNKLLNLGFDEAN
jgi:predicted TIM-barrel fold metal-dependent hydrolase